MSHPPNRHSIVAVRSNSQKLFIHFQAFKHCTCWSTHPWVGAWPTCVVCAPEPKTRRQVAPQAPHSICDTSQPNHSCTVSKSMIPAGHPSHSGEAFQRHAQTHKHHISTQAHEHHTSTETLSPAPSMARVGVLPCTCRWRLEVAPVCQLVIPPSDSCSRCAELLQADQVSTAEDETGGRAGGGTSNTDTSRRVDGWRLDQPVSTINGMCLEIPSVEHVSHASTRLDNFACTLWNSLCLGHGNHLTCN